MGCFLFGRPERGITLIELIISLSIVGILSSVVLVSFPLVDRRKLETESNMLAADLVFARESASSCHQDFVVHFDITNDRYAIYKGSIDPDNEVKARRMSIDLAGVTDGSGTSKTSLTFSFPWGVTTGRTVIAVTQHGRTRYVNVTDNTALVTIE